MPDFAANGFGDFIIPIQDILGLVLPPDDFANQTIAGTSQFTVLLGFIFIIFISLALAAAGIAIFFYLAHRGVKTVQETETTDDGPDADPAHPRNGQDRWRRCWCHPRCAPRHRLREIR